MDLRLPCYSFPLGHHLLHHLFWTLNFFRHHSFFVVPCIDLQEGHSYYFFKLLVFLMGSFPNPVNPQMNHFKNNNNFSHNIRHKFVALISMWFLITLFIGKVWFYMFLQVKSAIHHHQICFHLAWTPSFRSYFQHHNVLYEEDKLLWRYNLIRGSLKYTLTGTVSATRLASSRFSTSEGWLTVFLACFFCWHHF